MTNHDLKPCPFCGNDEIKVDSMRFGLQAWCPECLAHGPTTQVAPSGTAQSAWNDLRAAEGDLRARAEAAEADLSALAATVGAAVVASALAPGESLSAPPQHIIVSQVNRLRARAEAAEAEAERLRSAIAETLRLADIYAGVAAHNAKAEPETAGEAWRSPYMATMRELRRALGGAA